MIDNKILMTIVGLLATVFAINAIQNKREETREDFWGDYPFDISVVQEKVTPTDEVNGKQKYSVSNTFNQYQNMVNPEKAFYTVPGTMQSELAPRMFAGSYGANITYNLPSTQNLAVDNQNPILPPNPLDFANAVQDVQENFTVDSNGNASVVSCGAGGESLNYHGGAPLMQGGFAAGNYNEVLGEVYNKDGNSKASHASLPVGDMTTVNALGQKDHAIIYDRYIFSSRRKRHRAQGDKFRGDLPIVPENNGWFNVSVNPNIDLEQGAMNVMGGYGNETSQQLANLVYTTSGDYKTTIGGSNIPHKLANASKTRLRAMKSSYARNSGNMLNSVNMGNQYNSDLSAAGGDINVTTFP